MEEEARKPETVIGGLCEERLRMSEKGLGISAKDRGIWRLLIDEIGQNSEK